jgi:hypothetical protein
MNSVLTVISVVVSLCAFLFAAFTWRASLEQHRRDLFLTLHERLNQADAGAVTQIPWNRINCRADAQAVRDGDPEQWQRIIHVIATFDTLGLYVAHGYIDRELAFEVWGPSHADIYEHGCFVLDVYETELDRRPWNYFEDFAREAAARRTMATPAVAATVTPALDPD